MRTAAIIKPHRAGLFSLINNVVTCLSLYDHVHVDWSEGCIYGDAWPHLFRPTQPPNPAFFDRVDVVTEYPHQMLTYKNAGLLYRSQNLIGWRKSVNHWWSKLESPIRGAIHERLEDFKEEFEYGYTSVLVRSEGHGGEQESGRAQTKEDYLRALELYRNDLIFLMASDEESISWFKDFPNVFTYPHTRRAKTRASQIHLEEPQTIEDAVNCFVEAIILSRGTTLIHPVSNIATFALYANPEMKSIYLP